MASTMSIASQPLWAQTYSAPPEVEQVDKNGIDLLSGSATLSINLGSIGIADGKLNYSDYWSSGPVQNSMNNYVSFYYDERHERETATVVFENSSKTFRRNANGTYTKLRGGYGNLVESTDGLTIWDTLKDGEVRTYGIPSEQTNPGFLMLLTRALPNGVIWTYEWQTYGIFGRPMSITNNLGYKITIEYLSNGNPYTDYDWGFEKTIRFYNLAVSSNALSSASRSKASGIINITTAGGQQWSVSGNSFYDPNYPGAPPFTYKTPSSSTMNFSFNPKKPVTTGHRLTSVVFNGITYNYDFYLSAVNDGVTEVTDPLGSKTTVQYKTYTSPLSSAAFPQIITDPLGNVTNYTATGYIINSITRPEGDKDIFTYGARTNIELVTHKAKPGSGLADTTEASVFPATCTNTLTCNRPTSYTDKNLKTTTYEYSPAHGGLTRETLPADPNGINPVKRYYYAQRFAWIQDGSGGYMHAGTAVWLKTEERTCRSTATVNDACEGGSADEVVTTYDYGLDSGPNNLLLRGVVVSADGQSQRTCYTYDQMGNKISETKPLGTGSTCP